MSRSQRAKVALAMALCLLCLSGIAAGFTIFHLARAEELVHHTYDVEVAIGDVEASLAAAGRSRVAYVDSATAESLRNFQDAVKDVGVALQRLRDLTLDPAQKALCDQLETIANERIGISQESVDLVQRNQTTPEKQLQMTFEVARTAIDTAAIVQQMRSKQDDKLAARSRTSRLLFDVTVGILAASFLLSGLMFQVHYQLLNREVLERRSTENQLRQLSLQLIRAQDEERRRFARELHDGLGQTLVGAKMLVDTAVLGENGEPTMTELASVLNDAISQTRAISYLFHPPLLDEAGFASAARWLVEGYAQRMGMGLSIQLPETTERMPRTVEITLYRVLQEALNNIYRHARSAKAEVSLEAGEKHVTLRVRDHGRGIPRETLAAFRANATQVGVGLTGMRERVREQGGDLEIRSDETGTEVIATIPIPAHAEPSSPAAAEPILNAG